MINFLFYRLNDIYICMYISHSNYNTINFIGFQSDKRHDS